MMASMAQPYSPHPAGLQHPGLAQGHPMAGAHPQQGGQPVLGMQQVHMGVSGPGVPQGAQPGALLGGIPQGAGVPSAHALQHLNPNQMQIYQQQQAHQQQAQMNFANNPNMHLAQQQLLQHQRQQAARQMMAQQYNGGMPMNMPNGMNPQMTQAQFAAMRGAPTMRPVALPQHLQAQQQQAQLGLEAQQAAQHQQAQQAAHQQMMAQQMAMQQANAAHAANNQGQPNPMPQQLQNIQNVQLAAQQAAQQQQQQQQQQAANQQAQGHGPAQAQQPPQAPQQPQVVAQLQPHPVQPITRPQQIPAGMMMQPTRDQLKGQCFLKLVSFGDHLSSFYSMSNSIESYMADGTQFLDAQGKKQQEDLDYWSEFVRNFFSFQGVLRHSLWDEGQEVKQYEITYGALARYFYTHFESGIHNMQLITEKAREKALPLNCTYIESAKASFIYLYENGSQLVANGTLRVQFDSQQKIELLEFVTNKHEEYIPKSKIIETVRPLHEWQKEWRQLNAPQDGKQSPEMSKKGKARPMKSPAREPPEINIPVLGLKMGITPSVFRFLEFAEVMGMMNPLFQYTHLNPSLAPYNALDSYVTSCITAPDGSGINQAGQRTPGLSQFPLGQSPAAGHLNLPDNNSMIGGSPAPGHMQAPSMALQQSQQGTSSSGPSANASPNVTNKRRRTSVKGEDDVGQPNGVPGKVKPSPRMAKRNKGAAQS